MNSNTVIYYCPNLCGKTHCLETFKNHDEYCQHIGICNDYKCSLCSKKETLYKDMQNHVKKSHYGYLFCRFCGSIYDYIHGKNSINKHAKECKYMPLKICQKCNLLHLEYTFCQCSENYDGITNDDYIDIIIDEKNEDKYDNYINFSVDEFPPLIKK